MPFSGSAEFAEVLLKRPIPSSRDKIEILDGCEVNGHALIQSGFKNPILILHKDGLRIKVPAEFDIHELLILIDPLTTVDVIDVREQNEVQMPLRTIVESFDRCPRDSLLNMLSLEFSNTGLSSFVEPPHVVSELSLVSTCWIPESTDDSDNLPSVQKYCLLSMAGSYTDFHIDFGGSSVWYHVVWGEKIFYLVSPTPQNLSAFWKWMDSPESKNVFFPDLLQAELGPEVSPAIQLRVTCGQTILLPSAWIHAVYTVSDCLVFGGNFLNEIHIPSQLSVYKMEQKSNTPRKYQFPHFEKIHWFAADRLVGKLTNKLYNRQQPLLHEVEAAHSLLRVLPRWLQHRLSLPIDDRTYYLPSLHSIESSYSQLIEKLGELVALLSPSKRIPRISPQKLVSSHPMKTQNSSLWAKPGATQQRLPKSRRSHKLPASQSLEDPVASRKRRVVPVPRKSKHQSNYHDESPSPPEVYDPSILEALPELQDSRLVDDHYYLDLYDSDDEHIISSPKKSIHRKSHDPDPTWSLSNTTCRKQHVGPSKHKLSLGTPIGNPDRTPTHPLLYDAGSKSNREDRTLSGPPHPSTSSATTKRRPALTARQRLAKRLGLS